jgi:hypothetical protein
MNNDRLTTLIGVKTALVTFLISQHYISPELGGLLISLLMALQGYFTNKRPTENHPEDTLESINSKDLF